MTEALIHSPIEIMLVLVAIILVAPILMKKINLPGLVGMLVAGIIIGPNSLHVLEIGEGIELLAEIGLLYIMFLAGLELDLQQFMKVKEMSAVFGILAVIFPWTLGFATAFIFGMSFASAFLVGIIISSHTLLAYPIISELGVTEDEAVTITIGATIITDLVSLVALAILIGNTGPGGFSLINLLMFLGLFASYIVLMIFIIPKILTYFFSRELHEDEEFLMTFVTLFLASFLAELAMLEAIIGAFFAGLAVNRLVPKHSRLMQKIEFMGRILFIPLFMIYIGMRVDIAAVLSSLTTILLSLSLIVAIFLGKFLASFSFGKMFDYSQSRVLTMFSLSIPQVGVTLATILVGVEIGLLEEYVLNAGIILMMVTATIPPILTGKYAKDLVELAVEDEEEHDDLTAKVVLPVSAQSSKPGIIDLAGILVQHSKGILYPLHIIKPTKSKDPLDKDPQNTPDKILERAVKYSHDLGIDVESMKRVNDNLIDGILHGVQETNASMMMMEWHAPNSSQFQSFSETIGRVLEKTPVPTAVVRLHQPINTASKSVLILRDYDLRNSNLYDLIRISNEIAATLKNDLVIINGSAVNILSKEKIEEVIPDRPFKYEYVGNSFNRIYRRISPDDLIMATIPPYFHSSSFGWESTAKTSMNQLTHRTDNSLILFKFPRKKITLEIID